MINAKKIMKLTIRYVICIYVGFFNNIHVHTLVPFIIVVYTNQHKKL